MLSKTIALLCGLLLLIEAVRACGPGRAGGRRIFNRMRNYPPLVQRQYIPNVSENTFGASGAPEGPIRRHDQRFKELVQNWNPDIEFRDDERTGADRMMSQRLKEKLSVLAISVMNQWPNVRLRVIEGWDEDRRHSTNSLHYEGRAVDITTSDKDRSKYGMLARLAVEAGFDWVHYESRSHVHCSVKSEKADAIRNNGCFDGESLVETPMGQMEMSQLQTNDLVMTMNPRTGELQFSPVLMWLDRDESGEELYVNITTKSGKHIRLTSSHLIYLADEPLPKMALTSTESVITSVNADLNSTTNVNTMGAEQHRTLSSPPRANDGPNGGNLYYYELVGAGNGAGDSNKLQGAAANNQTGYSNSATSSSKLLTSERNQTTSKLKRDDGQTIAPATADTQPSPQFGSPTRPANEPQAHELSDFIYTTYARNAIVGQYLLIHKPVEQLKFVETHDNNQESGFRVLRPRSSGPNRLALDSPELETSRYSRMSFKSSRNSNTKLTPKTKVMFDEIVSVNYVSRQGIYAPLTRDGNIVVNSVVASCYAVISDHDMAHLSMAPVRWFSSVYEKLFGLRPETPTHERTVNSVRQRDQLDGRLNQRIDNLRDHMGTTSSLNRIKAATRHVHWYPILLYNIARYVLPNNYLY